MSQLLSVVRRTSSSTSPAPHVLRQSISTQPEVRRSSATPIDAFARSSSQTAFASEGTSSRPKRQDRAVSDVLNTLIMDGGALSALMVGIELDPPGPFLPYLSSFEKFWSPDARALIGKAGERTDVRERALLATFVSHHAKDGRIDLGALERHLDEKGLLDIHAKRALEGLHEKLRPPSAAGDFTLAGGIFAAIFAACPELRRDYLRDAASMPESLPGLDLIKKNVPNDRFADCVLVCAQHLLPSQLPMFEAIVEKGALPRDLFIAGVPYSTNALVESELESRGCTVFDCEARDPELNQGPHALGKYEEARRGQLDRMLESAVRRARETGKKIVVLDDGGLINKALHERFPDVLPSVRIVEQTTRGLTEASQLDLKAPVINVAKSPGKNREGVFIARSLLQSVVDLASFAGIRTLKSTRLTIVGFGTIGAGLARDARAHGLEVSVVEHDEARRAAAKSEGFAAFSSIPEAAKGTQILVGCTGHRSISKEDLLSLPHGTVVASGSSAEVEIDVGWLASSARTLVDPAEHHVPEDTLAAFSRPTSEQELREFWLGNKTILLARNGRPMNFGRGHEDIRPEHIQLTRCLMFQGAAEAARLPPGRSGLVDLSVDRQTELLKFLEKSWKVNPPPDIRTNNLGLGATAFQKLVGEGTKTSEAIVRRALTASDDAWIDRVAASAPERYPRLDRPSYTGPRVFQAPNGDLTMVAALCPNVVASLPIKHEQPTHLELVGASAWPIGFPGSKLDFLLFTTTKDGGSRAHRIRVSFPSLPASEKKSLDDLTYQLGKIRAATAELVETFEEPKLVSAHAMRWSDPTKISRSSEVGWEGMEDHKTIVLSVGGREVTVAL